MRLLLLLAAMIVARSQCAQWVMQNGCQNDDTVMAGDKELKPAADQTLRAYAGEYNLQKLLGFKHTPLYEWVPATKKSSFFSELLDNADDEEGPSVGQQVLQAATADSENALLFRLLQLYDLLPVQTSKWRKRRRPQEEDVQLGPSTAELQRQRHDAALDCSDNSSTALYRAHRSSSTPPQEPNIIRVERKPDVTPSHNHLLGRRTEDREVTVWGQERSSSDRRMKAEADGAHREAEDARKDYPYNQLISSSWGRKRATPFSVVGAAWRRAFNSWGGKRNPAFNSWGGKRSDSLSVQGNSRSWEVRTDPSLGSEKMPAAFSIVGSRRYPPAILSIADKPTFTVLSRKTKPAFSIWDSKSKAAFKILASHDYPVIRILGTTYKATPAYSKRYRAFSNWGGKRASVFSSWGGKRGAEMPDWDHQAKFFKRGPQFSSWGGKRYADGDTPEKRGFSSWGGKRNLILDDITQGTDEMDKRRFSSWSGKSDKIKIEQNLENSPSTKNSNGEHDPWQSDKERRNASTVTSLVEAYQQLPKNSECKIQFSCGDDYRRKGNGEGTAAEPDRDTPDPAAKDQNSYNSETHGQNAERELLSTVMKRSDSATSGRNRVGKALFKPWGGKRSHVLPSVVSILGSMRRVDGLLNKRASTQYESLGSKKWDPSLFAAVFSSWGGKRSDRLIGNTIQKVPPQSIGRQFRRGTEFYSWGGRR